MPQRRSGSGIDLFIATSSAAPAILLVVTAVSNDISGVSAMQAAQSTYEGLNGALRELKTSIELVQEACEAIIQGTDDREAARQVREALVQVLERWDFAKGELRTLGTVVQ